MTGALASALMFSLTWYPGLCPWLLPVCLIPLWHACWFAKRPRDAVLLAWFYIFVVTVIGFYWVGETARTTWALSRFSSVLVLLGFSALAHLHIPISMAVWVSLRRRLSLSRLHALLLLALVTYLLEMIYPRLFPYNHGYPWLWSGLPVAQIAEWIGFTGLSLVTLVCNAVLLEGWLRYREGAFTAAVRLAAAVMAFLAGASAYGWYLRQEWRSPERRVRLAYVQDNQLSHKDMRQIYGPDFVWPMLERLMELTREVIRREGRPDLVVWPENILLIRINTDEVPAQRVKAFVKELGVPLVAGMPVKGQGDFSHTSVVTLLPNGRIEQMYNKMVLMPMGEYVPGAKMFPALKALERDAKQFVPGDDPGSGLVSVAGVTLATHICYEALFPWLNRELVGRGARILLNLSSDRWFGESIEAYQHAYMALARAIEFRRPFVRVTSTGLSAVALADGELRILAGLNQTQAGVVDVPYRVHPPLTVYHRYGGWIPWLAVVSALSLVALGWRATRVHQPQTRGELAAEPL